MMLDHTNSTIDGNSPSSVFHNQIISFIARDGAGGVHEVNTTMTDIDYFNFLNTKFTMLFSAQFSACLLMAVFLLVMTSRKNYTQPVFIFNLLSLVFGFIRSFMLAYWLLSPWSSFYNMYSYDLSDVPRSAYYTSVATTIFPLLMLITVNASLMIQAHSVCKTMDRIHAYILSALSIIVVLLSIAFRFGQMVINSQVIMLGTIFEGTLAMTFKQGTMITSTVTIWWFSLIFCYKLVNTVRTRRRNGWKRYSTLRVLAIMSCCTMVIPSIFAILQYTHVREVFPEVGTLTLTLTALLLPLSTIWAKLSDQEEADSIRESIRRGAVVRSSHSSRLASRYGKQPTVLVGSDDRKGSVSPLKKANTTDNVIEWASTRDSIEIEIEKLGIRVDRS